MWAAEWPSPEALEEWLNTPAGAAEFGAELTAIMRGPGGSGAS